MLNKFSLTFLLILTVMIAVVAIPVVTSAQGIVNCGKTDMNDSNGNPTVSNPCDFDDFINIVVKLYNYLLVIIIPIATISIAYAGVLYMVYSTNDGKRKEAHDIITSAVWGLAVALAGYVIVTSVFKLLANPETETRVLDSIPIEN